MPINLRHAQVPQLRLRKSRTGGAFTLVELLVVISIITILASMLLVALSGVQETSRVDRTRAQIGRIHTVITEKWEQYRSRRVAVPMSPSPQLAMFWGVDMGTLMQQWRSNPANWIARYNVDAVREMMRMELPERKTDLLAGHTVPGTVPPALWFAYRSQARKLISQKKNLTLPAIKDPALTAELDRLWSSDFESAECLYLILTQMVDQDRSVMEFFSDREVGDFDNDGMPEIIDSWGRPIVFARWAPGLQIAGSPQDFETPDPFDMRGVYPTMHGVKTFALYPLVSSAGPDQRQEIYLDNPDEASRINYATTMPRNNPFLAVASIYATQTTQMVGAPQDSNGDGVFGSMDNITNHNLTGS